MFSFDTRAWRSLRMLLFSPGRMEAEFTEGKRVRYVPPVRLYLFVSFFFFLLLSTHSDRVLEDGRGVLSSIASDGRLMSDSTLPMSIAIGQDMPIQFNDTSIVGPSERLDEGELNHDAAKLKHILQHPERYLARFMRFLSWSLFILMPVYGFLLWVFFRRSRPFYLPHLLLSMSHHMFAFVVLSFLMVPPLLWPERPMGMEFYLLYLIPVYSLLGVRRLYGVGLLRSVAMVTVLHLVYAMVILVALIMVVYFALV